MTQCKPMALFSSPEGFLYNWSFHCNLKQNKKTKTQHTCISNDSAVVNWHPRKRLTWHPFTTRDLSYIITPAQHCAAGEHRAGSSSWTPSSNYRFSTGEDGEQLSYSTHLAQRWSRPLSPRSNGATIAYSSPNLMFSWKQEQTFLPLSGSSIFCGTEQGRSGRQLRQGKRMECGQCIWGWKVTTKQEKMWLLIQCEKQQRY